MKIKEQSWWGSALETLLNIGSGFILSWCMWVWVVGPIWGIPFNMSESLELTTLFTITSVIRSFAWRRLANWRAKRSERNSQEVRQG